MANSVPPISSIPSDPSSAPFSVKPASSPFWGGAATFSVACEDERVVISVYGNLASEEDVRDLNNELDEKKVKDSMPMDVIFDLREVTHLGQDGLGPISRVFKWWFSSKRTDESFEVRVSPQSQGITDRIQRVLGHLPIRIATVGSA